MITNSSLTVYHKVLNEKTHDIKWIIHNYDKCWWFGGKGAGINKGYENANDVQIRIPYKLNNNLDIKNFAIGDILVKGTLENDIQTQQDLSSYEVYNINSLNNNTFGKNPHIYIGGK